MFNVGKRDLDHLKELIVFMKDKNIKKFVGADGCQIEFHPNYEIQEQPKQEIPDGSMTHEDQLRFFSSEVQ
jgi:hypothetical protein